MNSVSFSGSFKSDIYIKSKQNDDFAEKKAKIVELDKNNENDLESLHNVSLLWSKESSNFVPYLFSDFIKDDEFKPDVNQDHCLILTLQDDNFENIDPKKVLGVSLFSEEDIENELNWLQVQPKNNSVFSPADRTYKGVGRAIVSYIKNQYTGKPIYVNSSNTAINFYKKLGFETYDKDCPCSLHCEV
ncbi:GNAT family N-acetyltransferase [bacterium]|nr:GNAT family N-acetyltransferase [bacterium]